MDGRTLGVGEGPSRRIAETSAAAQALDVLRQERAASRAAKAASPGAAEGAAADPADADGAEDSLAADEASDAATGDGS